MPCFYLVPILLKLFNLVFQTCNQLLALVSLCLIFNLHPLYMRVDPVIQSLAVAGMIGKTFAKA
jgi:hypothetical protein